MFTGIIEELGTVKSLDKSGRIARLEVLAGKLAVGVQAGQSICVNGVCLTAINIEKDILTFEVMQETITRSSLGLLKAGEKVNLERALKADGRIDGHFVTGHIDGTGIVTGKRRQNSDVVLEISAEQEILGRIVLKGSVALDGISLTVSVLGEGSFSVSLIPYTLSHTSLSAKKTGDTVNIECDLLGKYTDRFLTRNTSSPASRITPSFLNKHGF